MTIGLKCCYREEEECKPRGNVHNNPPSLVRKCKKHDTTLQVSHTNIALLTFSLMQDLSQGESEEESVLMDQPRSSVGMQQEVMDALKGIHTKKNCLCFLCQ